MVDNTKWLYVLMFEWIRTKTELMFHYMVLLLKVPCVIEEKYLNFHGLNHIF